MIGTLPQAKSLVKGIISESGGGRDIPTVADAQTFMSGFVTALNCSLTDVSDSLLCLTCPEGRTMLTGLAAGLMHSVQVGCRNKFNYK